MPRIPLLRPNLAAPQRQAQPEITEREVHLCDPVGPYRSANGVVLSRCFRDKVQSASHAALGIMDPTGEAERTLNPAEEREERDRCAGPALPVESGVNRRRWALRPDPAATFPGMSLGMIPLGVAHVAAHCDEFSVPPVKSTLQV